MHHPSCRDRAQHALTRLTQSFYEILPPSWGLQPFPELGLGLRVLLKGRISCWWTMLVRDALVAQGGYEVNPWVKRCSLQRQVTQQMSKPVHIDIRVTNAFL